MENKRIKAAIVLIVISLTAMLAFSSCGGKEVTTEKAVDGIEAYLKEQGGIKKDEDISRASWYKAGDSMTDWGEILEIRAGKEVDSATYLEDLRNYVEEAYKRDAKLDEVKATEWHRVALAVMASGGDPTSFGKDKNGEPIDLVKDGVYDWVQSESLDYQGSNALMYALHVINASGAKIPEDAKYSEDDIIEKLLTYHENGGGFDLSGKGSSLDLTAMAVQALSYYRDSSDEYACGKEKVRISEVIDECVDYLSKEQKQGGYYLYENGYSSETCSQVVLALCSCGIDPRKDERFVKGGVSVADALMSFRNKDGGFASTFEQDGKLAESDFLASAQAGQALISMLLLDDGNGKYFDFSTLK